MIKIMQDVEQHKQDDTFPISLTPGLFFQIHLSIEKDQYMHD